METIKCITKKINTTLSRSNIDEAQVLNTKSMETIKSITTKKINTTLSRSNIDEAQVLNTKSMETIKSITKKDKHNTKQIKYRRSTSS